MRHDNSNSALALAIALVGIVAMPSRAVAQSGDGFTITLPDAAGGADETPGDASVAANIEPSQRSVRDDLFDTLVKFNFDHWNETYAREFLVADTRLRDSLAQRTEELAAISAKERSSLEAVLRTTADRSPATPTSLEAALRLASILLTRDVRSPEAGALLTRVLTSRNGTRMGQRTEWAALLLRAQWHLVAKRVDAATADFRALAERAEKAGPTGAEFAVRARIGLGDAAFANFLPTRAEQEYVIALRAFQRTSLATYDALLPSLSGLYVRLVWSAFRSGRSVPASVYAMEYARRRSLFGALPPAKVESELLRAGGVALYERNDAGTLRMLAADSRAGDFGKRLLLAALNEYIRAGRMREGLEKASGLEREFERSRLAFDFLSVRAVLAENAGGGPRARAEQEHRIVLLAARSSVWTKAFVGQSSEDDARKAVLLAHAEKNAAFFAEEGARTGKREDFLKSHAAYKARLEDFFAGEPRGALFLQSSQAALRGGAFEEAWQDARLAFRYPLSGESEHAAFVVLCRTSEAQARGALSPSDPLFNRHLGAVDSFVAESPTSPDARQFLFASAGKLERLGFLDEARTRYERSLALVPRTDAFDSELENVLRALLVFHMKHSESSVASLALSDMESVARDAGVGAGLRQELAFASAAQVRSFASSLRRRGALEKAVATQRQWTARHGENPEAPLLLRDSIAAAAELQDWKSVHEGVDAFLRRFERHPVLWQVLWWKGRAHESQLAFHAAAVAYVASAYDDDSRLSLETRLDVLGKAAQFLAQGGDAREASTVLERKGTLEQKRAAERRKDAGSVNRMNEVSGPRSQSSVTSAMETFARAASLAATAGDFSRAALLTDKAVASVSPGDVRALSLRLASVKYGVATRTVREDDLKRAGDVLGRWPRAARGTPEHAQAIVDVLSLENAFLEAQDSSRRGTRQEPETLARSRVRAQKVAADRSALRAPEDVARVAMLMASVLEKVGDSPSLPRTLLFEAYMRAPKGSDVRIDAARRLRAYTEVSTGELPQLAPSIGAVSKDERNAASVESVLTREGSTP